MNRAVLFAALYNVMLFVWLIARVVGDYNNRDIGGVPDIGMDFETSKTLVETYQPRKKYHDYEYEYVIGDNYITQRVWGGYYTWRFCGEYMVSEEFKPLEHCNCDDHHRFEYTKMYLNKENYRIFKNCK